MPREAYTSRGILKYVLRIPTSTASDFFIRLATKIVQRPCDTFTHGIFQFIKSSDVVRTTNTSFFIGIPSFLFVYLYRHTFLHFYLHFSKCFYFICFTLSATLRICSSLSPSIIIERILLFSLHIIEDVFSLIETIASFP